MREELVGGLAEDIWRDKAGKAGSRTGKGLTRMTRDRRIKNKHRRRRVKNRQRQRRDGDEAG